MPYYPQDATGLNYITYPVGPTASEAVLTASASANTKGSYTEIIASLGFTCNAAIATTTFQGASAAGRQLLIDIATGAGGAETVVVPNLISDSNLTATSHAPGTYFLPLSVTSGTRIAARNQANTTGSQTTQIALTLIAAGGVDGITPFVNYGADTSDSGGLEVDPGGAANTKGSYAELTASSSAVAQFLLLMVTLRGNTGASSGRWLVDIATGAAASEVVLIPDVRVSVGLGANEINPRSQPFLTYIAAGTRIAVRASSSITDATDRLIDVALLAGTAPAESSAAGGSFTFQG